MKRLKVIIGILTMGVLVLSSATPISYAEDFNKAAFMQQYMTVYKAMAKENPETAAAFAAEAREVLGYEYFSPAEKERNNIEREAVREERSVNREARNYNEPVIKEIPAERRGEDIRDNQKTSGDTLTNNWELNVRDNNILKLK